MKLTATHWQFYRQIRERNAPMPLWASRFDRQEETLIDRIVNLNAGIQPDLEAHNSMILLRKVRVNERSLVAYFVQWGRDNWLLNNNPRRAYNYRKWASRLQPTPECKLANRLEGR